MQRCTGSWSGARDSSDSRIGVPIVGFSLMGDPLQIAIVALGLSLGVSAIRLGHWFIHSDPKIVVRAARWAAIGLLVLSFPVLLVLLVNQQWTAAVVLATVMVLVLAWYGPRLLRQPFRLLDPAPERGPSATETSDVAF